MIVRYHVIQDSNYLTFDTVANMLHHVQKVFHYDADTISLPSNMDGQTGCKSYYEKMGWVMEIDADLIIGPKTMKNQIVIENTSRLRHSKHFVQNLLKSTTVLATRRHYHADSSTKKWPICTQMSYDSRAPNESTKQALLTSHNNRHIQSELATPISVLCTQNPSNTALTTSVYRITIAGHVSKATVRPIMKPQKNTIASEHVRITHSPSDVRSRANMICACVALDNQVMLLTKRAATKHTFSRFWSHSPRPSSPSIFADNCLAISAHSIVTFATTEPTLMTQYETQAIDHVSTARWSDLTKDAHTCAQVGYTPPNTWNHDWTIDWFIGINACIFESFDFPLDYNNHCSCIGIKSWPPPEPIRNSPPNSNTSWSPK